jgi:hypothetical protein
MDAVLTAGIVAVFGAMALALGWALHRLWRAVMREDRPVLLHRMLARHGARFELVEHSSQLEQAGAAVRRCVVCREQERCLAWLDGGGNSGYEAFCPNAGLIARLKAEGRAA